MIAVEEKLEAEEVLAKNRKYMGYIHEASLVEIVSVAVNMSAIDWDEISNTQFTKTKRDFVAKMLNGNSAIYCRCNGIDPVIVGGLYSENPGVGTIWAISTDKAKVRDWIFVTRWLNMMFNKAFDGGFHRIQAYSVPYREKSQRWMENKRLGMKSEGRLHSFCENGNDVLIYYILKG